MASEEIVYRPSPADPLPTLPQATVLKILSPDGKDASTSEVDPSLPPPTLAQLTEDFWDAVASFPWKFTSSSVVLAGHSAGGLMQCFRSKCSSKIWRVQCVQSILFIEESSSVPVVPQTAAPLPQPYVVVKCALPTHRLLILVPGNTYSRSVSGTTAIAPEECILTAQMCRFTKEAAADLSSLQADLDGLLHWIRSTIVQKKGKDCAWSDWILRFKADYFSLAETNAALPKLDIRVVLKHLVDSQQSAPPLAGHKRPRPPTIASDLGPTNREHVSLAIIVPFRDQPTQNRMDQLKQFAAYMPEFISKIIPPLESYHVIVVEQSNDGYKFNRGKCLNIGFLIATDPGRGAKFGLDKKFNAFCFHDVDLFPQPPLGIWYGKYPTRPIHIAAVWPRYRSMPAYVGGALTMNEADFRKCNGFPNNMWGWGGEDDVLADRMSVNGLMPPDKPGTDVDGTLVDMEEELIKTKGGVRAGAKIADGGRQEWRCLWKKELRAFHQGTRHFEGLATVEYALLGKRDLAPAVTVFTVDLFGARDPAVEILEPIELKLKPNADTVSIYVSELTKAYDAKQKGLVACSVPVGRHVAELLTKEGLH